MAEAVLADQVGIDFFGVGEHHREDFAVSAPEVVLAAIAGRTERIHLGSAVTVLSSDDPVRVFERFSTLDAVSGGRAEVILGRGSFIESFPLFGFPLEQYEQLFEEKLAAFAELLQGAAGHLVGGDARAARRTRRSTRRPSRAACRRGSASAAARESVVRAAHYGLPLMLAIIGGEPMRFAPYVDLYHRALAQFEQPTPPDRRALARLRRRAPTGRRWTRCWPHYEAMHARIGSERGWPPMTPRRSTSTGPGRRARCSSARPRRWPRRSSRPSRASGCPAST